MEPRGGGSDVLPLPPCRYDDLVTGAATRCIRCPSHPSLPTARIAPTLGVMDTAREEAAVSMGKAAVRQTTESSVRDDVIKTRSVEDLIGPLTRQFTGIETSYAKDEDVPECCQVAFSQDVHAEQYVKAGWNEFKQRNLQRALASTEDAYDRSSLGGYSMFRNRNVESNCIGRGCLRTVNAHYILPTNGLDSEDIDDLFRNTRDRCSRVQ